jgi:hypothetical protein
LVDEMRTVRENTILIAEDIPENECGYRPTPDSRSVAETLVHIAMLSQADRFLHEEEHRPSLEDLDFGDASRRVLALKSPSRARPDMALQGTLRPRFRSGRSLCSLGSALDGRPVAGFGMIRS